MKKNSEKISRKRKNTIFKIEIQLQKNSAYYFEKFNEFREKCSESYSQNPSDIKRKCRIKLFLDLCQQRPTCEYVICNRCLYKKSVKKFNESDYEIHMEGLTFQVNKKNIYVIHDARH